MKTIIAGALGECVHVAGVSNFLRLAEKAGWRTVFLGPAVSIENVIKTAEREKADVIGVSYRLTPETCENLIAEFAEKADHLHNQGIKFLFGGTPETAERAARLGFFEKVFFGDESETEVLTYLRGGLQKESDSEAYPSDFISRVKWKTPFPLIRHHFGLPSLVETIEGIYKIANAKVLDVISLGLDQDAQENFFHPERQKISRKGAGGVPIRKVEDFENIYYSSQTGNKPLLRSYSGTDDFIPMAEILTQTIRNAWCAIPLFWFNQMDGRGPWDLEGSIDQHLEVIKWYADRQIPVELNEPHHWGMRDAPDVIYVVAGYLSAFNAKHFGVKNYIAQFMFNSPSGTSDAMDLAKMLAILELIKPLESSTFKIWKQTRTGLLSFPAHLSKARAHLSSSIYVQMALKPDIIHVVGHTEAFHAATPDDVIEACHMAQRVIENSLRGMPDLLSDKRIMHRVNYLTKQARVLIDAIIDLYTGRKKEEALINSKVLAKAVKIGLLDAPQLKNNQFAKGVIKTQIIGGACEAVDRFGKVFDETVRVSKCLEQK